MLTNTRTEIIEETQQEGQAGNLAGVLFPAQQLVKVSAVIPTLNEEKNLAHVLPGLQQ